MLFRSLLLYGAMLSAVLRSDIKIQSAGKENVKNEEWKKCFKIIGTDFSIGWCHTNQLGRRCSISFWNGTLYVCDVFDRQYFSLYWRDTFFLFLSGNAQKAKAER